MPDEEEKIEVAVGPDFKPPESTETQPLAAPVEEEIPDIEPPEKWWTEIEDEEGLKGHDRAKPWLEEAENNARRNVYEQVSPLIQQRTQQFNNLVAQGGRFVKDVERATRDGTLDLDLAEKYEGLAGQVSGAYWYLGQFEGARRMLLDFDAVLGDDSVSRDFKHRVDLLEQGGKDEKLFPDLLKRLQAKAGAKESEASEKKGYDKGVADGRRAAVEEIRARQRENNGPDLNRKTTAGGTALSPERYKDMSHEERAKLTPAQIDAMTADLASRSRGLTR